MTLFSNTLKYALARGASGLCSFLTLAVFARLLGPRGYGEYALTIAVVGFGYAVLFQWLSLATVRLLKSNLASHEDFLAAVRRSFLRICAGVGLLAAILLLVPPFGLTRLHILLGGGLLVGQSWLELNLMRLTAEGLALRYGLLSGVRAIVALTLGTGFALAGWGAPGVLLGVWGGQMVPGIWIAYRAWKGLPGDRATGPIEGALFRYAAPLVVAYLLDFIISASDRLLLGAFRSTAEAGTYAAAYDLTQQTIWLLMMAVNLAAYPLAVAAAERRDAAGFREHCRRHFTMVLGIGLPAAAGLALLAPTIVPLVLGKAFDAQAVKLIPVIGLAAVLGGMKAYYFDLSFQLGRSTIHQLAVVSSAAMANLLLNLWWIPAYGVVGAAYSTMVAYLLGLVLSIWFGRRVLLMPLFPAEAGRIMLGSAVMVVVLLPLRSGLSVPGLALTVVLGIAVYTASILLLNPAQVRDGLRAWWQLRQETAR